ncbi:hypothetical protein FQR65_LT15350 [Abscondita terminalis]|nr:hypothetical protein FQR65_LT15350 [Abscondita terminalis]
MDIQSTSGEKQKSLMAASTAVQSSLVRDYLNFSVDRSKYISYYSSALDNGSNTSSFLRNVYTARDVYAEQLNIDNAQARIDLADGKDPLKGNENLVKLENRND